MSIANPLWGAPRIHGELLMLGIDVGQTTVAHYMVRSRRPPSQGWKTFLRNHADCIASMDLSYPRSRFACCMDFRAATELKGVSRRRHGLLWKDWSKIATLMLATSGIRAMSVELNDSSAAVAVEPKNPK